MSDMSDHIRRAQAMAWLNTQPCWVMSRDANRVRLTVWIGGQRYAANRAMRGDDLPTLLGYLADKVKAQTQETHE